MLASSARLLASLFIACLLSACASSTTGSVRSGTARAVEATTELGAPDSTSSGGEYTGASEYRVGAQDLLEISVFQVPDLNRTVRVNSNGQVSLPLIGVLQAGGKTVQELEAELAGRLDAAYLQNPQVTVFVKEYTSQRVTVEGAVNKPGIYPVTGRTSLLQAIAQAEGVTDIANLDGIVVFRTIEGQKMAAVFSLKQIRSGDAPDPQIYGDDIIVVDTSAGKSGLRQILQVVPFFNLFRVY